MIISYEIFIVKLLVFVICTKDSFGIDHGLTIQRQETTKNVYISELIRDFQNEPWNEDEIQCKESILMLLHGVQNSTLWAVWVWDSINTKPTGNLYGSLYQLGNFDQCLDSPWASTNPELQTKYCLADIELKNYEKKLKQRKFDPYGEAGVCINTPTDLDIIFNLIHWGVCVPTSCGPQSVERFVSKLLEYSHFGAEAYSASIQIESCQDAGGSRQYHNSFGFYSFFVLICGFIVTTLAFSYINSKNQNSQSKSTYFDIACCFSIEENYKKLTATNKKEINVINGIRFLSTVLAAFFHRTLITASSGVTNKLQLDEMFRNSNTISYMVHGNVIVDTFIMLSGVLFASTCISMKDKTLRNLGIQLVKRYFRLTTALVVIVMYITTVAWYVDSGPVWPKSMGKEIAMCRKNWWLTLLTLNTYIDRENMCYVISWTSQCDMHFAIIGTALVYVYSRNRKSGILLFAAAFATTLIIRAVYTVYFNFPPEAQVSDGACRDFRQNPVFVFMYFATHYRMGPYFVGMGFGYYISMYKPKDYRNSISTVLSVTFTSISLWIMYKVVSLGHSYHYNEYTLLEAVLFSTLNRQMWAFAVCLIIVSCEYGNLPFIKEFLGWYVFRPLARLSYGVLLIHVLIFMANTYSMRTPIRATILLTAVDCAGTLVLSFILSLMLWLCFEAPVANLCDLWLSPRRKLAQMKSNEETLINSELLSKNKTHNLTNKLD